MGVSDAGKTTVGRALAERTGWTFADADDLHLPANVAKMARGEPLTDTDREGWLRALSDLIGAHLSRGEPLILACSALKARYRDLLRRPEVRFVFLEGRPETIRARLGARAGHYMKAGLLESQFEALERPRHALVLDVRCSVPELVDAIVHHLEPQTEPRREDR
jgi:gluconokinase